MHEELAKEYSRPWAQFRSGCRLSVAAIKSCALSEGIDEAAVRKRLLQEYNLEIGAGLGAFAGKVWRIELMGYSARQKRSALHQRAA